MRHLSRILPLLAAGLALSMSPAARAIPQPSDLAGAEGEERVELLLSVGLARDAEAVLRAELEAGRTWARAPLVRMLVRSRRGDEAERLVRDWGGPDSLATEADRFTWGRLLEAREAWAEAAEAYARSAEAEPLLADLAAFRAGITYRKAGDSGRALEFYEKAGASARSAALGARAHWEAATAALAAGEPARALTNLENVPRRSPIAVGDLLSLEAGIQRALGRPDRELRVLRDLVDRAPASEAALAAVDRLRELQTPTVSDRLAFADVALRNRHAARAEAEVRALLADLDGAEDPASEGRARLQLGKALIATRQYTAARQELAAMPGNADVADRAEALLDRARCLWRLDRIDACLAEYDAILDGDWPAKVRSTALWEAGREAKDNRRWEEAAIRLGEFQRLFPDDDYADDAAWHRGRALTELGRTDEAVAALDLLLARYPDSELGAEAGYWLAGLRRSRGDRDGECAAYATLLRTQPDSYWAERARSRLADEPCPPDSASVEGEDVDPFAWLAGQLSGVDAEVARRHAQELQGSERFRRARILAQTGLGADAEAELEGLRRALERDSAALLGFAQNAWLIGVPREAMRAVLLVKARTGKPILSGDLPAAVARLLYPVDHLDAVLRWSREYGLDPWFVYAVMREESWFDPQAVSWAGAHGLLQIMPSTGRDLARRVGLASFERTDLLRPEINIRLGTFYLSELLDDLDREPALALSAYNAGKGNALRWRKNVDGEFDVDRYVAGITYRETYGYVQRVTRTWAIYRRLYDGLLPALAETAPPAR